MATFCCAGTFVGCMLLFMALGQFLGNRGMTTGMYDLATAAPAPTADLLQGLAGPAAALVLKVLGQDTVQLLEGVNATLAANVPTGEIRAQLDCVAGAIEVRANAPHRGEPRFATPPEPEATAIVHVDGHVPLRIGRAHSVRVVGEEVAGWLYVMR